jgi:hypothetical protein
MKVSDLAKTATFVVDSQDVFAERERYGIDPKKHFDSFFIIEDDTREIGTLGKFYGMMGIVPDLDKDVVQLLTQYDIYQYLKSPNHCPYCESTGISSQGINFDDEVNCDVICDDCGQKWNDKYNVTRIETYEED